LEKDDDQMYGKSNKKLQIQKRMQRNKHNLFFFKMLSNLLVQIYKKKPKIETNETRIST